MVKITIELDDDEYARLQKKKGDKTYRELLGDALDIAIEERKIGRPTAFDPAKYEQDRREKYLSDIRKMNAEGMDAYIEARKQLGIDQPRGASFTDFVKKQKTGE